MKLATTIIGLGVMITLLFLYLANSENRVPAESPDEAPVATNTNTETTDTPVDPRIADFEAKPDLIRVNSPEPGALITSPLTIQGEARGYWFFEASAPVVLTNWDGLIIAEGFVTAEGSWMTEDLVPFSGTLVFTSPYTVQSADFMKNGTLILKKDNPSGLPENDDALEIPVTFTAS